MQQHTFAKWILFIASVHFSLGLFIFNDALLQIFQQGVIGTIGPHNETAAVAFWFLMFALPLGLLAAALWRQTQIIANHLLYLSIALGLLGALFMPASGFWTIVILAGCGRFMNWRKQHTKQVVG